MYSKKRARSELLLHAAIRRLDLPRIKSLVDAGAPLTEIDGSGCTPVHLAVGSGLSHEMVKVLCATTDDEELLEALCTRAHDGLTPLHLVASLGDPKLMKFLLSHVVDREILEDVLEMRSHLKGDLWNGNWGKKAADGELEELDVEHMNFLHLALERLDPNVDEDDDDGPTRTISGAARTEAVDMVRLLIECGANVNARDAHQRTPLHLAVGPGDAEMTELLLKHGADPTLGNKRIGMSNSCLHQAVLRGQEGMVKVLLRAAPHLDVDAAGQNGLTPLCLAARSNQVACATALVEAGADPKVVCRPLNKSALDIAKTNKRTAILKLFGEAVVEE